LITRVFDIPLYCLNNHPRKDIFASKQNSKWKKYSTKTYFEISTKVAIGFMALGLKKGDKIATICSRNLPEWNFIDMGMSMAGIIHVPIYPSVSNDEFKFIFNQSSVKYVFVSDKKIWDTIEPLLDESHHILKVYSLLKVEGLVAWKQILHLGEKYQEKLKHELNQRKNSISPDDTATLIYTSGTTGNPKGVLLSHKNLVSNTLTSSTLHTLNYKDKVLSFLPLSHIYERTSNYQFQVSGICIYYAEDINTILKDLREIKPQGFTAVPRVLEKIRKFYIEEGKKQSGLRKKLFLFALQTITDYPINHQTDFIFRLRRALAEKLVFRKLIHSLGGRIKFIGCGGAKLSTGIEKFFWAAGLPLYQGYGLTETSPLITLNRQPNSQMRIGTVGPVIPGVKVKIANDGEILCKGPNVMQGYFKEKELTKKAIDNNGWFHTGDLGHMNSEGFLFIKGRKKDLFKTSYGKYVAPQAIESRFRESALISQLMVIGEGKKFTAALIIPDFEHLIHWVRSNLKIPIKDKKKILQLPQVTGLFEEEVNQVNQTLGMNERIKKFQILSENWSVQSGEFSPSLKLKRNFIKKKFSDQIEGIYQE